LRELYDVSVPELDCIVESALDHPGVLGARLTGAGFGGCAVVLLRRDSEEGLARRIEDAFERRFGRRPAVFFFRSDAGPRELARD
jgi:galactokinase